MGNIIINENIIMNLTCLNLLSTLLKETLDYFYSFFEKRIKQFSLIPGAKDYEDENKLYSALKEKKENIYFDLYIEDILQFDQSFRTIFQIFQNSHVFFADRKNFIVYIKSSTYYLLSILKFFLSSLILITYFCYTINDNNYVCLNESAFNNTMTNNTFINNSYSNNNSFDNDLPNNYSYWYCDKGKCKVDKVKYGKIKILRVVYFVFFDIPLIAHGIYFLKSFKKLEFKKKYIISYQAAEYIFLLRMFFFNFRDTQSSFSSKDGP